MKKAFFAKLLVGVILIISFVFTFNIFFNQSVYAAGHTPHDGIEDGPFGGNNWDKDDSLPTEERSVHYLTKDVTISSTWRPQRGLKLCLNGHSIKMVGEGSVVKIEGDTNTGGDYPISIYDCSDVEHKYKINEEGLAVVDDTLDPNAEGVMTFKGGYITGGNSTNGGCFDLTHRGDSTNGATNVLTLSGVNIVGNKAENCGGAIYYPSASHKNCQINLKNVSIIGNVAGGIAGGIYHEANNKSLTLENTTIINNVSKTAPAGVFEESELKIKGNIQIHDNKLIDGTVRDVSVGFSGVGQPDKLSVIGKLNDESKIGFFQIKRQIIYDYYTYCTKDPNEIFYTNTYQSMIQHENNISLYEIPNSLEYYYDGKPKSLVVGPKLAEYGYKIKYKDDEGTYKEGEAPSFTEVGEYYIDYELTTDIETKVGKQYITIHKALPLAPLPVEGLYYTGEGQDLLKVQENSGATFEYKVKDGYWTSAIPKGLNIGTYEIQVRAYGDNEHSDYVFDIVCEIHSPDRTAINEIIEKASAFYEEIKINYGIIGINLNYSITIVKTINNDANATVAEIEDAIKDLEKAMADASANKEIVDNEIALIDSIGEVTYTEETKIKIDSALVGYSSMLTAFKPLVTNYDTLTAAYDQYNKLKNDNELASNVISSIDSIGEVTIDSKEKIDAARASYESLTDEQKALVTNYETLTNAEALYDSLVEDKEVAKTTEELISEIGEVAYNDESKEKIDLARASYESLTEVQKALVSNYDLLPAAEARYEKLKNDFDTATVTQGVINDIGEVTLESKEKIDLARASYESLTETQKLLVTNYDILTAAEARYAEILANKEIALEFDNSVANIGEVSLDTEFKNKINALKASYNKLNNEQKSYVTKYEELIAKEDIYDRVGAVYRTINSIGEVGLNSVSKTEITNARQAYDSLTQEEKSLVTNYVKLYNAEATYNIYKKANNEKLLAIIIIIISIVVVVLFGGLYILFFFVFNSYAVINSKEIRVFKLGKKYDQYKLLKMNFRIVYCDEENYRKK